MEQKEKRHQSKVKLTSILAFTLGQGCNSDKTRNFPPVKNYSSDKTQNFSAGETGNSSEKKVLLEPTGKKYLIQTRVKDDTVIIQEKSERKLRSRRRPCFGQYIYFMALTTTVRFYNIMKAMFVLVISYMSFQVIVLAKLTSTLHRLAGLQEFYSEDKYKALFVYTHLLNRSSGNNLRKLGKREWLTDHVLDRGLSELLTFTFFPTIMELIGIRRPIQLFLHLKKALKSHVSQVLVYLRDDPHYDESKDLDYMPDEDTTDDDEGDSKDKEFENQHNCVVNQDDQENLTDYESCETGTPPMDCTTNSQRLQGFDLSFQESTNEEQITEVYIKAKET